MLFAVVVFVFSFLGIVALFSLKYWELKHERIVFEPFRRRADIRALQIKELGLAARTDLARLLPEMIHITRAIVHEAALAFAALARFSERQAHRLADLVSHKRGFEKRETRSEFLKKVAEHKNGGE